MLGSLPPRTSECNARRSPCPMIDRLTWRHGGGEHACTLGVMLRDRGGCDSIPARCIYRLIAELIAPLMPDSSPAGRVCLMGAERGGELRGERLTPHRCNSSHLFPVLICCRPQREACDMFVKAGGGCWSAAAAKRRVWHACDGPRGQLVCCHPQRQACDTGVTARGGSWSLATIASSDTYYLHIRSPETCILRKRWPQSARFSVSESQQPNQSHETPKSNRFNGKQVHSRVHGAPNNVCHS